MHKCKLYKLVHSIYIFAIYLKQEFFYFSYPLYDTFFRLDSYLIHVEYKKYIKDKYKNI